MPATSIPNLVRKWVSATGEFLTKKNAAEPLLRLVHNGVARILSGETAGKLDPSLLVYWNHCLAKNCSQNRDFKEVKAKNLGEKGVRSSTDDWKPKAMVAANAKAKPAKNGKVNAADTSKMDDKDKH